MDKAKRLYRRLDELFGELPPGRTQPKMLEAFLEDVDTLRDDEQRLQARVGRLQQRMAVPRDTGPVK